MTESDFEDILVSVGARGRFQKSLVWLILVPAVFLQPLVNLNILFLYAVPDHWCHVPGREDTSFTAEQWKELVLPKEIGPDGKERYSQCRMYDFDYETWLNDTLPSYENITSSLMQKMDIIQCRHGWEFDNTDFLSTAGTDNSWVCDSDTHATNLFTAASIGSALGTIVFGQLADIYGRKPMFFVVTAILFVFRVISFGISHIYYLLMVCTLIAGGAFPTCYNTMCTVAVEFLDKESRSKVYTLSWIVWVFGMCVLSLLGWLLRDWISFGLASTIPIVVIFFGYRFFPESPRWLVSVGRVDDAEKLLLDVAKTNGTSHKITPQLRSQLEDMSRRKEKKQGVLSLFSRPRLRLRTLIITFCWGCNTMLYNCLHLNLTYMSGNPYINFFLLAIIEVPAAFLGMFLCDCIGRRYTHGGFLLITTACFIINSAVAAGESLEILNIVVTIAAKFSISLSFLALYMQAAELYPTCLRMTGLTFSSTVSGIVGIFGPYIVYLGGYHVSVPFALMSILCFLGAIASVFLPETLNVTLPETMEDAERFTGRATIKYRIHDKEAVIESKPIN